MSKPKIRRGGVRHVNPQSKLKYIKLIYTKLKKIAKFYLIDKFKKLKNFDKVKKFICLAKLV